MDPSRPTVRYYDTRRTRPWFFVLLAVVVAGAAVAVWFGTDMLRADGPGPRGVVTVDGGFDEKAATQGAQPIVTDADPADDPIDATSMAMVGDSITAASADAIRYTLTANGFLEMDINGEVSRRIEEGDGNGSPLSGLRTLFAMLGDPDIKPDVWVIALGTNDVGQYKDPEDYRRLIDAVLAMLPDGVPLVWVDTYRYDQKEASITFNDLLVDELGKRDNSVVASWHDQASRNAETKVLRDDGVHPNDHGRVVFAALVAEGIAAVT
jgi:lysophospholipase L1-like esterase